MWLLSVLCFWIFTLSGYKLPRSWKHFRNATAVEGVEEALSLQEQFWRFLVYFFSRSRTGLFSTIALWTLLTVPAWRLRQSGLVTHSSCLTSPPVTSRTPRWAVATLWLWHMLSGIILASDSSLSFRSRCKGDFVDNKAVPVYQQTGPGELQNSPDESHFLT